MALLIEAAVFFEQVKSLWLWQHDGGGRSAVRRIFQNDPAWATSLMRRILKAPPCRVIRMSHAGARQWKHWPLSREVKVALVTEIGTDSCAPLLGLVQEALLHLEASMLDGHFNKNGLADIMEALASHVEAGVEWAVTFTNAAWEALLAKPQLSDDLRPLCRLAGKYSYLLPEGTQERVEDAVCSVAESIALGDWHMDTDTLREEAESLESLAEDVGVDIATDLGVIRKRADELQEESGRCDEDVELSARPSRDSDLVDDDEIASMFSMLEVIP